MIAIGTTILFIIIILYQALRGFVRGTRKQLFLLVHMAVAMGLTILVFTILSNFLTMGASSSLIVHLAQFTSVDLSGCSNLYDALCLTLIDLVHSKLSYVITQSSAEIILMFISVILNIVIFFLCEMIIYPLVKFFMYIGYMIIFRRKVNSKCEDGKLRLGGALLGAGRGLVIGLLVISHLSALYYIAAGGTFYTSKEYKEVVTQESFFGMEDYYEDLKTLRSSGIYAVVDKVKLNGEPIDYFLFDQIFSHDYNSYLEKEENFNFRKDIGNYVGIVTRLYETGVITFDSDGFSYDITKLNEETIDVVFGNAADTFLIKQLLPTMLIDIVTNNSDSIPFTLDVEMLKKLNLANDLEESGKIIWSMLNLLDYTNMTDGFSIGNIDYLGLDADTVDALILSISNLTLLTEIAIPFGIDMMGDKLGGLVFDLDSIIWNEEIANLQGIYGTFIDLGFTTENLKDFEQLIDIFVDEDSIDKINEIIKQVFKGELFYNLSVTCLQFTLDKLVGDDESLFSDLNIDLDTYSKDDLIGDIMILTNNFVNGYSLYEVILSGDVADSIFSIEFRDVKKIFLGDDNNEEHEGIMDLKLLSNVGDDFYGALLSLVPVFGDAIGDMTGINWNNEFEAVFDTLIALQDTGLDIQALMSGDFTALEGEVFDDNDVDAIVNNIVKSEVLSRVLVQTISDPDGALSILTIPSNIEWYGEGNELDTLLRSIFVVVNSGMISSFMEGGIADITSSISGLDDNELNAILDSKVINATLTTQLSTMTGDILVVPDEAYQDADKTLIKNNEIILVLDLVDALDLDLGNFDMDNIKLFTPKVIAIINESLIMSRTIVSQLYSLTDDGSLSEVISIPNELSEDNTVAWYGANGELNSLLVALASIFGEDATLSDLGEFNIEDILNNSSTLFNSVILTLTVSDLLVGLDVLNIPSSAFENVLGSRTISQTELNDLLESVKALGLTDLENLDFTSILTGDVDFNKVFISSIISLTISHTLIPSLDPPSSTLVGDGADQMINQDELAKLFNGLKALGITSLDSLDLTAILGDNVDYKTLFASDIIRANVSEQLIKVEGLIVPNDVIDVLTCNTKVITNDELVDLMLGLKALGITSLDEIKVEAFTSGNDNMSIVLNSKILHATISDVLFEALVIVEEYYTSETETDKLFDSDKPYVDKDEIINLLSALGKLGLDIDTMEQLNLSNLDNEEIDAMLRSYILATKVSELVIDIYSNLSLSIETKEVKDWDGKTVDIIRINLLKETLGNLPTS